MENSDIPKGFEYFDQEKPMDQFTDLNGELKYGWHILNIADLESIPSRYVIYMHERRLGPHEGMGVEIGTPTYFYEQEDSNGVGYPVGMYGLYHAVYDPEKITWLNSDAIQAEEGHQVPENQPQNKL